MVHTRSSSKKKDTPNDGGDHATPVSTSFPPTVCRAFSTPKDILMTVLGFLFLAISLPPVACVVGCAVLWYFVDPITLRVMRLWNRFTEPLFRGLVRKEEDAFIFNIVLLQGGVVPALFAYVVFDTLKNGEMNWYYCLLYHILRIGPYFSSFAYAYTLCHKEGHVKGVGIFKQPYSSLFGNVFNWWVALFYGVVPSTFAYGHTVNHHQYNNSHNDVVTTWDRPRDSFLNYVGYLPRWVGYALNITCIKQFYKEGKYNHVMSMFYGSVVHFLWVAGVAKVVSPVFCVAYLVYPLIEATLLLSAINWSWHCFLDRDTQNIYASSVTIFEGGEMTNIMNEDYHVVHHQYPGAHWTKHPSLFEKHREEYINNRATCFKDTHAMEIFFLAVLKEYDVLTDKFVDLSGKMSREEKKALIVERLRTCEWGEYCNKIK